VRPATGRPARDGSAGRPRGRVPRCRVCGRPLGSAVERKLTRCTTCPGDRDEALFERLRAWRLEVAQEQRVPAFVVFTDATLTAIAEARPSSRARLAALPGVGAVKLDRYGDAVLELCAGDAGSAVP
jgi:DNA helicase-2/ATP-dependent DNA helicase PcrA